MTVNDARMDSDEIVRPNNRDNEGGGIYLSSSVVLMWKHNMSSKGAKVVIIQLNFKNFKEDVKMFFLFSVFQLLRIQCLMLVNKS